MSIKPFSTLYRPPLSEQQTAKPRPANNSAFNTRLEELLRQRQNQPAETSRVALEARLLALSMTRGLLEENPSDGRDYFPNLLLQVRPTSAAGRQAFQPLSGQNFDTRLQPLDRPLQEHTGAASPSQSVSPLEDIIARASRRYGVDQDLVRAVIRTESSFDPDAVSPVGAQGLMQLMPETARELGVSNPFDAEQNVMGGTRYLRQLLDRYDGDLDRTLAAYNWGMGNVDRRGLEQMPRETRNYLTKVKEAGNLA